MSLSSKLRNCTFGAIFWVRDTDSGIPKSGSHPFIVLEGYDASRPYVVAVVRSSTVTASHLIPHVFEGSNVDGFDKPGWVDPGDRWNIDLEVVKRSKYSGHLPQELCERLRQAVRGGVK